MVDDDVTQIELTKLSLESVDPRITMISSTKQSEAQEILHHRSFDCVVSDYQMSEMNGVQLCAEIRKTSKIPFIIYTARGSEEVASAAFAAGVDDYIRKEPTLAHYKVLAKRIMHVVEKSRAEVALKESQDQLSSMLERVTDNFVAFDVNWRYIYANDSALRNLRKTRDEVIGKVVWDVFPDLTGTVYGERYREAMEKQISLEFEAYYKPFEIWTYMRLFPSPQGLTIYYHDVTELRRRREDETRLASFPQLNPNPILEVDFHGKISYMNPAAESLFPDVSRIRTTTLLTLDWVKTLSQLKAESSKVLLRDVEVNGIWYSLSLQVVAGANSVRIYAWDINDRKKGEQALMASNEKLFAVNEKLRKSEEDLITFNEELQASEEELKTSNEELSKSNEEISTTEEELRVANEITLEYTNRLEGMVEDRTAGLKESEQRLRGFMESSDEGYSIYDSELRLLDLNGTALGRLPKGTKREDLIGKRITEIYPDFESSQWYPFYIGVLRTGEAYHGEGRSVTITDGMLLSASVFKVGNGLGVVSRDITERRSLEERLHRAEVISAVEQMGATVAHDLRGPLGQIVQSIQMAKQDPNLTLRMLQMAEENAIRSLRMIADWRSSTREIVPQPVATDLGVLVNSVIVGAKIPLDVDVQPSIGAGLESISVDPDIMHRVLDNLVRNAVEAMPHGGKLLITAKIEGDKVVIRVSDTGVGIPEESRGRIFSPLYTTKVGGMGLGLTYCRRAVEAQGGSIDFESYEGIGTTLIVALTK